MDRSANEEPLEGSWYFGHDVQCYGLVAGIAAPVAFGCNVHHVHFIVMGCGRVGSTIAIALENDGHSVSVIDQNPNAFRRLGSDFAGQKVTGMGFDRTTLTQAGITEAYGFAAVSSGDNSNVLAARVVRETFGVSNVVARIYDPARAEVYERLGIPTVATVRWTADQVLRRILPAGASDEYRDPSGRVALCRFDVHPQWIGLSMRRLEELSGAKVAFLTRLSDAMIPTPITVLQDSDLLYMLVDTDSIQQVERTLIRPPVEEES